jgi:hypothetical protein
MSVACNMISFEKMKSIPKGSQHLFKAVVIAIAGPVKKKKRFGVSGSNLANNFNPSARGCNKPLPARFGPTRS